MAEAADLLTLVQQRAYASVEEAWEQALESPAEVDVAPLVGAADLLSEQAESDRASVLLAFLAESLLGAGRQAEALDVLRRAVAHAGNPEELRRPLAECVRAVHGSQPGFEAYFKLSGLGGDTPLDAALRRLDDFLDFEVGRYVLHAAGWGVGRVASVDARSGDLTIDFERKRGHVLPIVGAVEYLQRLPSDCLQARAYGDLEGLRALAQDNPADLVRLAVVSRGGHATGLQIKKDLTEKVLAASEWSKVWSRARRSLTHDPLVEITPGSRAKITIRKAALRFSDEIIRAMEQARSFEEVAQHARRLTKEAVHNPAEVSDEERLAVAAAFAEQLEQDRTALLEEAPGLTVAAQFLLEELAGADAPEVHPALAAARTDLDRFLEVARGMPDQPTLRRYVEGVRAANPESFAPTFAEALTHAPKDIFHIVARTLLEEAPELLRDVLERIAASSDPDPEALFELCRELFAGRFDALEGRPDPLALFEKLIAFCDRAQRLRSGGDPQAPNARPRLRTILAADDHGIVRTYFAQADKESARHTYRRLLASPAVDDEVREVARTVVARHQPDLLSSGPRLPWEDESVIYTTEEGLAARQRILDDLVNNKIPENARAIGDAAAFGDLSENAEFTAALEERDQLIGRTETIKRELDMARPLGELTITGDIVGPGTTVELVDARGDAKETYTILGPWDVDLEHHVISYTAPLAQGLLGRRVGDAATVMLPGGGERTFRVHAVRLAADVEAQEASPPEAHPGGAPPGEPSGQAGDAPREQRPGL